MVLKSSIHTSALPRQQWSDWGLKMIKNAYFSLIAHTKQLLFAFVHFVILLQELELVFGHTVGRTADGRTEGQTDMDVEIVI